ncbi:immunity protein [Desulfosporosinus sp. SYSU MS00001]|uniref:immunity protein n=1 Tax=Desulfosporosinus sp. SYSU MS00001 TaxID=3416284 RepID=UPI003CF5B693
MNIGFGVGPNAGETPPAIISLMVIIFAIFFFVSVLKYMKKKIELDKQKIEQINMLIEIFKNVKD